VRRTIIGVGKESASDIASLSDPRTAGATLTARPAASRASRSRSRMESVDLVAVDREESAGERQEIRIHAGGSGKSRSAHVVTS